MDQVCSETFRDRWRDLETTYPAFALRVLRDPGRSMCYCRWFAGGIDGWRARGGDLQPPSLPFTTSAPTAPAAGPDVHPPEWVRRSAAVPTVDELVQFLRSGSFSTFLTIIGVGRTIGSLQILPPRWEECLDSFAAPLSPSTSLSVGGKAWTKHLPRSETDRFWGRALSGNAVSWNAAAAEVLVDRIYAQRTWMNTHCLPHDVLCFEVRNGAGYGARWTLPTHSATEVQAMYRLPMDVLERDFPGVVEVGVAFRGFLEPPRADGHEHGWHH